MNELKPCPFCGCHAKISETRLNLSASVLYTVSCINKKTCFQTDFSSFTKETAVKYWNTRPAEDAKDKEIDNLKAENERLKKALQAFIKWDKDYPPGGNPMSGFYEFNTLISDAQFLLWEFERNGKDINVTANAPDINVGTMERER